MWIVIVFFLAYRLKCVVKIGFNFGYKIDIFRDNRLKYDRLIQCYPSNNIAMKSLENIKNAHFLSKIRTYFNNTSEFGLHVHCPLMHSYININLIKRLMNSLIENTISIIYLCIKAICSIDF